MATRSLALDARLLIPQPSYFELSEPLSSFQFSGTILLVLIPSPASSRSLSSSQYFSASVLRDGLKKYGISSEIVACYIPSSPHIVLELLLVSTGMSTKLEAYELIISSNRISISSQGEAGLFYGVQTLLQIFRLAQPALSEQTSCPHIPALIIRDAPEIPRRGVMLDISRDKVPTLETLFHLVDLLSSLKYNELQLYIEHTFAYRGHEEVWKNASPICAEDILRLDAYCAERHIELVPNQNRYKDSHRTGSFGHFHRWLKLERYRPLAECPEGVEHPFVRDPGTREPFSLCATDPAVLTLLADLYAQLLPNFSHSRFVNVGCDETFDLGSGRSIEQCQKRGKHRVYTEFLKKIDELVKAQRPGARTQFWADIVLQHPDHATELPMDAVLLIWGYEANHPFDAECRLIREYGGGRDFYVCPGTSSWSSLAGRTANSVGNIAAAVCAGRNYGALGMLLTDWGDHGHQQYLQPLSVSYAPIALAAGAAWNTRSAVVDHHEELLPALLDLHVFQDSARVLGKIFYDLGNAHTVALEKPTINYAWPARVLLQRGGTGFARNLASPKTDHVRRFARVVEAITRNLEQSRPNCADAAIVLSELAFLRRALLFAARAAEVLLSEACSQTEVIGLESELDMVCAEFRAVWLSRNRNGGLADSLHRLECLRPALKQRILQSCT